MKSICLPVISEIDGEETKERAKDQVQIIMNVVDDQFSSSDDSSYFSGDSTIFPQI